MENIKPHKIWNGLIRIPYNWEDDIVWLSNMSFVDSIPAFIQDKYYIINFHPIHIFLNTELPERYNEAKKYFNDYKKIKELINTKSFATRDSLIKMLETITENGYNCFCLDEVALTI